MKSERVQSCVILGLTINVGIAWRVLIGPMNENLEIFENFCKFVCATHWLLISNELMIYKGKFFKECSGRGKF